MASKDIHKSMHRVQKMDEKISSKWLPKLKFYLKYKTNFTMGQNALTANYYT